MLIQTSGLSVNIEFPSPIKQERRYVFFLHGFSGSSADWFDIIPRLDDRFNYAAVDLPGHGKSECPVNSAAYSAASITHNLFELFKEITAGKFILAGYSMGGKAALSFAVKHQALLNGLILESSSPGITDITEREKRVQQDSELISFIENNSLEEFTDHWMNIDLFKSQKKLPPEKLGAVRELKIKNRKLGLINTLRGFGTGVMPHLWDLSKGLNIKTLLISGELDEKYAAINDKLEAVLPFCSRKIIKDAGHNTHLEKPEEFSDVINAYLKEF